MSMSIADAELLAFQGALSALIECQTVLESLASNANPDGQARASTDAASRRLVLARLGGTRVVRTHRHCNGNAAKCVDNPLMRDGDVGMLRALSGATNTRNGSYRGAQFRGDLADRAPALLRASPDGVVIEQVAAG